jgi:pimeloyl-ACP methyl ester carboxylesterase
MPSVGMKPLQWRLERVGFDCRLFAYPSYRCTISENAGRLAAFAGGLGADVVDVVSYSMGGVVLRWAANHCALPRLRRVVMIGPPNNGARMADLASQHLGAGFPLLFGRCAMQLRTGDRGVSGEAGRLPPDTEVAIIAGGTGTPSGFNPLIGRDNDRIVAVDETFLDGMKSFTRLPIAHGPLVFHRETAALCARFLRTGSLGEAEMEPVRQLGANPLARA